MKALQKLYKSPIIPVIRITGQIDQQTTLDVQNGLNQINPHLSKALAVIVNSPGGSPTQADLIIQKLTNFSKQHHLTIYSFAEEVAMAAGYYILSAGDKVYADQTSQIGCIGQDPRFVGLKLNKDNTYSFDNEKNLWYHKVDDFVELNEVEEKTLNTLHQNIHEDFEKFVEFQREINLNKLNLKQKIIYGQEAKTIGLVDDIGNFHKVMGNMYPRADVVLAQQKNTKQKFHMYMRQALEIIKNVNNRQKKETKFENQQYSALLFERKELVTRSIERINIKKTKAIAVIINCPGGSLPQSYLIVNKLKLLTQRHNIPLYTFGEDIAASSGYFILSAGDYAYADHSSQISCAQLPKYQEIVQDLQNRKLTFKTNNISHSIQAWDHFNAFQEIDKERFIPDINKSQNELLKNQISQQREGKLKINENPDQIYEYEKIYLGEQALNLGLVDSLGNFQDVLQKKYPDSVLEFISDEVINEIITKEVY